MIKNHDWTQPYHGVIHMIHEGIQNTICDHEKFFFLQKYSWHTHTLFEEKIFFKRGIESNSILNKDYFWNCGENALLYAKTYAEGIDNHYMSICKDDMSRYEFKK